MAKSRPPVPPARWALQDAKNRLSEVVEAALAGEPQVVTRRGIETAVIISHDQYARLTAAHDETHKALGAYLLDIPAEAGDARDLFERIPLRPRRTT